MKRIFKLTLTLLLIFGTIDVIYAQKTGIELYNSMGDRSFMPQEGSSFLNWLPGDLGYMEVERTDEAVNFYKVDPTSKRKSDLFDANTVEALVSQFNALADADASALPFSNFNYVLDNTAIFFTVDKVDYVFKLDEKELTKLYKPEIERAPYTDELMRGMSRSQLWNGTYSNDFTKFAYVKDYDIYLVDTQTKEEIRVTFGGSEHQMNGQPSWVYPEEFNERDAYWFSPDDSKIAYLQYNEDAVHQYPIVHDLSFEAGLELERYPKAGADNPTVKLFIVDLETQKSIEIETNSGPNTYIVRPIWRNDGSELTFRRLNRQQNHIELLAYNLNDADVRTILEEKEDTYINLHDNFIQLDDNETFIWTSEISGYNQIYHYSFNGKLLHQLTDADKPVASIAQVDQKNKKVYYTAHENMGLETHFHVVNFDGTDKKQLTREEGTYMINMNEAATYYTAYHSSFDMSPTSTLYTADGKKVRTLMTTNTENVIANNLEKPEFIVFKADDGTTDLPALIYKPVDFDPDKKYPVVLPLYGGPESQDVANSYKNGDGYQRLAQLGFIVIRANYRGSGKRGKEFASLHYKRLGTLEIDDYAKAIKVVTQRAYADENRVGVYGHSYGGYATALLLLRYPDVFQVGVSGAPVTDWRSYDTIYTERYMDTPQNNKEGYDLGSSMKYAENLKGKLLLVHGTTDNNVHPGNTMHLVDALVNADKDFDLMLYPENRHGIMGLHGRHYNKLRLTYFIKHLQPENVTQSELGPDLTWSN